MARDHRPPVVDYRRNEAFLFLLVLLLVIPQCAAQTAAPSPKNINQTNPNNFSPSMATVIVVLISAFFFLVFFSVYVRQCAGEAAAIAAAERAGVRSGRRRVAVGLKQEVLETFPTMAYADAKALNVGHGDLECAVCLSEFEDDETLRLLPGCCHVFHPDCIGAWLASHVTCPVCRSDLTAVALEQPPAPFEASPASDAADPQPDPVVIVIADRCPTEEEAMELARIGSVKREERSKRGRRPAKFPRSHSTGHSLAQPLAVEDGDRYTLRLPPHIQRELFAARKFLRSTSCVSFPVAGDGSSRPGYRIGVVTAGEGSSRGGRGWRLGKSDRWPSLIRNLSTRMPSWKRGDNEESVKKGEAESSSKGKFGGVRTPFDCLGGSGGGVKADLLVDERPLPQ